MVFGIWSWFASMDCAEIEMEYKSNDDVVENLYSESWWDLKWRDKMNIRTLQSIQNSKELLVDYRSSYNFESGSRAGVILDLKNDKNGNCTFKSCFCKFKYVDIMLRNNFLVSKSS